MAIETKAETRLNAAALRDILKDLAKPDSLKQAPCLHSWLVQEYRDENPQSADFSPEFVIGQALEQQLRLWTLSYRLDPTYASEWKEIFCLKAAYFQHVAGLNAYRKRPKLSQLGRKLADFEELAKLIPGREAEADDLLDAPDLQKFWYAFNPKSGEAPGTTTVSEMLKRSIAHFADWLKTRQAQKFAQPLTLGETDIAVAAVPTPDLPSAPTTKPTTGKVDPINLYLVNLFAPLQTCSPSEWRALIDGAAATNLLVIRDKAATGKTSLLYIIGSELARKDFIPLYVRMPEYAPFAPEMDFIRFVAEHGDFGKTYRSDTVRKDFENALADANREGKVVLLADEMDELFEYELAPVEARLKDIRRLVITERSPRIPLNYSKGVITVVPSLSVGSRAKVLRQAESPGGSSDALLKQLDASGFAKNLALAEASARFVQGNANLHLAMVLGEWIDQRLMHIRQQETIVDALVKARALLRQLAMVQLGISSHTRQPQALKLDCIRSTFRSLQPPLAGEQEGWALLDFVIRAGLLERMPDHWDFAYSALGPFFTAEQMIKEENFFLPFTPEQRLAMQWSAMLLASSRKEKPLHAFCKRIDTYCAIFSPLAVLDAADWLAEFAEPLPPTISSLRARVAEGLNSLVEVDSQRIRLAVVERSKRLRLAVQAPDSEQVPDAVIPPEELDTYDTDLPGLLMRLGIAQPRGTVGEWLENPSVQMGLIDVLVLIDDPDLKRRCAVWLRRSSLSVRILVSWLPPRSISTLEAVANISMNAEFDALTQIAARSVLTRDEFIVRMCQLGEAYQPLVYDLLLVLDKRLYRTNGSSKWEIVG